MFSSAQPLKYLRTQKEWLARNPKQLQQQLVCPTPEKIINEVLPEKVKDANFHQFLVTVQAAQLEKDMPQVEILPDLMLTAIQGVIKHHKSMPIDEAQLIRAIKSKKLSKEDMEKLGRDRDLADSTLGNLKIFLMESRQDYVNALRLILQTVALRETVFDWINKTFEELQMTQKKVFDELATEVKKCMQDILKLKVEGGVALVDKWFDATYQEQLITVELDSYKEVQFNYVSNFIAINEERIAKVIVESQLDPTKKVEASRYLKYLVLHVKRMCKF